MTLLGVGTPGMWLGFLVFVVGMLALDLGLFHRRSHVVGAREAAAWSALWVGLALAFGGLVHAWFGPERALEYLTGYLVEKALAVDNIFIFVAVFSAFAVPPALHHRVLAWGVLGALGLRAVCILLGSELLERFHWTIYLFGAILIVTGIRMFTARDAPPEITANPVLRLARRWLPSTPEYRGEAFFVREGGRILATPLFFALVAIELADILFAVDSIPAIFAITRDPFIVFTSNIFAILGLRAMYFLLADLLPRFRYLEVGLSGVLVFVGVKMCLSELLPIPTILSLGIIAAFVGVSALASALIPVRGSQSDIPAPPRP